MMQLLFLPKSRLVATQSERAGRCVLNLYKRCASSSAVEGTLQHGKAD